MLVGKSVQDGIIDHNEFNEFLATMKEKKDYDNQKMKVIKVNQVKLKLFKKIKPQGVKSSVM